MPNHDPVAIANEFIRLENPRYIPNQMKLQKLVFIANGWNVAISGDPLVDQRPEAWDNGPVFREIWDAIRWYGHDSRTKEILSENGAPSGAKLTSSETDIIEAVWEKYGHHNGRELSDLTHLPGTPWTETYFGKGRNAYISHRDVGNYYTNLAASVSD